MLHTFKVYSLREPCKLKQYKLYRCTSCHHRTTLNAAKKNGYTCFSCKSDLGVKKNIIEQYNSVNKSLKMEITHDI